MIRENLSPHIISEQFALDSFESGSALEERDQFGYGTLPRKMDHQAWQITNKNLLTRWRYMELMRMLNQVTVEFEESNELSRLFARMGVNTRSGNIYELYLEQDNLHCNYCFQVNLEHDAPFFVKVLAFVMERASLNTKSCHVPHRH